MPKLLYNHIHLGKRGEIKHNSVTLNLFGKQALHSGMCMQCMQCTFTCIKYCASHFDKTECVPMF